MAVQISVDEIAGLQESAKFLDNISQAVYAGNCTGGLDCHDDAEFKRLYYVAVERVKTLAEKLSNATVTVKS